MRMFSKTTFIAIFAVGAVAVIIIVAVGVPESSETDALADPMVALAMTPATCSIHKVCRDGDECREAQRAVEIVIEQSAETGKYDSFLRDGSNAYEGQPLPWNGESSYFLGIHDDGMVMLVRNKAGQMVMTKYFIENVAVVTSFGTCEVVG